MTVSFIGGGNRRIRRKPPMHLSQVNDKLYHIMLYSLPWSRFELAISVLIGTDCIANCKSNYHTITATTAPRSIVCFYYVCVLFVFICCESWGVTLIKYFVSCLVCITVSTTIVILQCWLRHQTNRKMIELWLLMLPMIIVD